MTPTPGTRLGPYEITAAIGAGRMGWLAGIAGGFAPCHGRHKPPPHGCRLSLPGPPGSGHEPPWNVVEIAEHTMREMWNTVNAASGFRVAT
jgi:hypothetical protein